MTATTYRTEAEWQADVIDTAQRFGWVVWHHHDSRRTRAGLPDLELIHPRRGLHIRAELKTDDHARSHLSPAQVVTLDAMLLADADRPGMVGLFVWRPADRSSVDRMLAGKLDDAHGYSTAWVNPTRRVREIRCLTDGELGELVTLGAASGLIYQRRDPEFKVRAA